MTTRPRWSSLRWNPPEDCRSWRTLAHYWSASRNDASMDLRKEIEAIMSAQFEQSEAVHNLAEAVCENSLPWLGMRGGWLAQRSGW